jgi:hypothetical protein
MAAARSALETLWRDVGSLAMDQPIGMLSPDLPEDLPADCAVDRDPLVVLAARRRVVPGAIHEALAYRVHDVIAVSVLQAPNSDSIGWRALDARWTGMRPLPPAGAMETVRIYVGQWPAGRLFGRLRGSMVRRAELVAGQVPGADGADWSGSWCHTADGLLLWELPAAPPESAAAGDRRMLAMSETRDEPAMDRWTWFSEGLVLPPLTRYLLHAAKLRHQRAVLAESLPHLRNARRRTEDGCGMLAMLLRTDDPPVQEVLTATETLGLVRTERGGLIAAWADANDMAQTVRAARTNMVSALGPALRCQPTGPIEVDREIADWMADQLATELTYLDSAQRKADELGRLAAAVIDRRQRQRQEALALLQTSVLGALLMALAAIQSFEYKVPLPGSMMAPLIALLATAALVLPAAALHWPDRSSPHRPARWRYVTTAGGLGATIGWLAVSTAWRAAAGGPAPPIWSAAGAAVAFVVAGMATAVLLGARWRGRATSSESRTTQVPEPP